MATTIRSTELDFDTIKARLKDFFKQQTEFSDYDFEASGISNILDVLAYNTHINGLNANFALNESFINTAQLRSSVVSLAEGLGYVPRSFTSSQATLNLSLLITASGRPTTITLPRNTQFTTSVDGTSFTFQTREVFNATDDGSGNYQFLNSNGGTGIPVFEGTEKTKTFFVGEKSDNQVYVIPDSTIDTSTIRVRVFPTGSSAEFETYTNILTALRILTDSRFYQIKEVPNGFYEVIFGDGTATGKAPVSGNKIIVDYLSTQGNIANSGSTFSAVGVIAVNGVNYNLTVVTESASAGGALKESIESIRQNAPIAFTSQRRLVTAEDYKAQILTNFNSFLDDVTSFGGEDNSPRQYGKVFVGLKFKDNITSTVQQSVKDQIVNDLTSNLSMMSIDTLFVDPETIKLELITNFNLDPDLTSSTPQSIQVQVQNVINNFFDVNLKRFNKVFRRSNLLTLIDAIDPAILNSRISIKMQNSFIPTLNQSLEYKISFPAIIASPDDENFIVNTTKFTLNNQSCFIRNRLNSNVLQIIAVDGSIVSDNAGDYVGASGTVTIRGFNPSAFEGSSINVSVTPANQSTIRPLRNFIIDIDTNASVSVALLDLQNTANVL
ncbi:MAG: hypothetical protein CL851_06030 [Crocinitomicaceae bacterium]|nr:hypothetical protein [Crocinitomicaceae bacterium]|tara:strand:- start:4849 stop:6678 length:1830 start_codon:yes stop_codon:yes gene_type:complete